MSLDIQTVKRRPGTAALTFDDGPDLRRTPAILDLLRDNSIEATFFLTGRSINAATYPIIRRMISEGHTIANHGYFHSPGLIRVYHEEQALIGRNFLLNQAAVDIALLATSPEDFKALYARLFGVEHPRFPHGALSERWLAVKASWRSILAERTPNGRSPIPMLFVRLPGGAPYIGKTWRSVDIQLCDREMANLGLVHVLWHDGVGDADPNLTSEERRDIVKLKEALERALNFGGILALHDRAPLWHLQKVLPSRARQMRFVGLEHYMGEVFGCSAREARDFMWMSTTESLDGSLCPWFCGE